MYFSNGNPFHITPRCQASEHPAPPHSPSPCPGLEKAASRLNATLKPVSHQAEAYMGFIASFQSSLCWYVITAPVFNLQGYNINHILNLACLVHYSKLLKNVCFY